MSDYIIMQIDNENNIYPIGILSAETEQEAFGMFDDDLKKQEENVYWELHRMDKITSKYRDDVAE